MSISCPFLYRTVCSFLPFVSHVLPSLFVGKNNPFTTTAMFADASNQRRSLEINQRRERVEDLGLKMAFLRVLFLIRSDVAFDRSREKDNGYLLRSGLANK